MRFSKLFLLCISMILLGKVGVAQYKLDSFSNEGIRIDGKPIHPGEQKDSYPPKTVIEIKGQQYQCKVLADDGDPAWLSYCCTKKGQITLKQAFSGKTKRHFSDKNYHEEDRRPIVSRVSKLKSDGKSDQFSFYEYLGQQPTQSGTQKFDTIKGLFETPEKLDSLGVSIRVEGSRLIAENRDRNVLYFVTYIPFGEDRIERLDLVGVPKGKMEELGIYKKGQKKYAYVFWCEKWDERWDCLDEDKDAFIKCYKVVF